MDKKDYYTLKEIILGLRDSYLLYRYEIDKLKQFSKCDDKRVKDYYFSAINFLERKDKYLCTYLKKTYFEEKINKYFRKGDSLIGIYHPNEDNNIVSKHYSIDIIDKKSFDNQLEYVFNMEIVNQFKRPIKLDKQYFDIDNNLIHYYNYLSGEPFHHVTYNPHEDKIIIFDTKKKKNYSLESLLETKIKSDALTDFQIETINNNNESINSVKTIENQKSNKELILTFK